MPFHGTQIADGQRRTALNRDTQLVLAAIGTALFLWLAFRVDIMHLHPVPGFAGRLIQIAPELAAFAAGVACLVWGAVTIWQLQPKRSGQAASTGTPEPALRRLTAAGIFTGAGYYMVVLVIMGERFARFLWPPYARRISGVATIAGLVLITADITLRRWSSNRVALNAPNTPGVREEGWFANEFMRGLFFFALGVGVIFAAVAVIRHYQLAHARGIMAAVVLTVSVGFVYLRGNSRRSATGLHPGTYRPQHPRSDGVTNKKLWLPAYVAVFLALMVLPIPANWKIAIFFGQIPLLMVYGKTISGLKMRIYRLGHDGYTDRALALDRRWGWLPGYGARLDASILFNAGRYREAQQAIWPTAFDTEGKPRLGSTEIYTYALALNNDGRCAEAQSLLENSIPMAAKPDGFRVALATNLLEQGKDPERARELLEQAMANPALQSTGYGQQADEAKRRARYAWALASCGQKQESANQIQAALEQGSGLKDSDLAGIHYFAGEAWNAAGERAKARSEFQESLRLMPVGVTAVASKKGLAKLLTT